MTIPRIRMRTGLCPAVWLVLLGYLSVPAPAGAAAAPGAGERYEGGSTPAVVASAETRVPPAFPAARRAVPKPRRLHAGVVFGGGAWTSEDNDGFGTLGLSVGGYPRPRVRVDAIVAFDDIAFLPDSALGKAFRNAEAREVGLDLTARYDPPDADARIRLDPLVGVGAGTMFWNYADPVTVVDGAASRTVGYDGIFYFSFYGGDRLVVRDAPSLDRGLHSHRGHAALRPDHGERLEERSAPADRVREDPLRAELPGPLSGGDRSGRPRALLSGIGAHSTIVEPRPCQQRRHRVPAAPLLISLAAAFACSAVACRCRAGHARPQRFPAPRLQWPCVESKPAEQRETRAGLRRHVARRANPGYS